MRTRWFARAIDKISSGDPTLELTAVDRDMGAETSACFSDQIAKNRRVLAAASADSDCPRSSWRRLRDVKQGLATPMGTMAK
jgi:hypothetical protein